MWPLSLLLVETYFLIGVHSAQIKPATYYFDPCHTSDPQFNKCLLESLMNMKPKLIKGIPELNLRPIEPLEIEKIEMSEGSGNFRIYQKLTNLKIYGMSDYKIDNMSFDYSKKKANYSLFFPKLKLEGDYELDGQILILPIKGKGKAKYICTNVRIDNEVTMEVYEKNKKKYARIKEYKIRIDPGHAYIHFTNLFNGDKNLGDSMNKFINENWREAFLSHRDLPEKAFGDFLKDSINNIYSKFPESDIFPK